MRNAFENIFKEVAPMKKWFSLLLVLVMALSMLPMNSLAEAEKTYNMPPMNTTDEIHLVCSVHNDARNVAMAEALAAKFHEMYPNITIEVQNVVHAGGLDASLLDLLANDKLPDFGTAGWGINTMAANNFCYDITEFVENDEEYQTLVPAGTRNFGYLDGERCYLMAIANRPCIVFLDQAMFEKLNVEMPDRNTWTFEDMQELMETMVDPSQGIFAFSLETDMFRMGTPSLTDNSLGVADWDGATVDLTNWFDLLVFDRECGRLGYKANPGSEQWLAAHPENPWPATSGAVAMYINGFWTWESVMNEQVAATGVEYVPYFIPGGEGVENPGIYSWIDTGYVSAHTEYPREAYEAMKFMFWGLEGWKERTKLYAEMTYEDSGLKMWPNGPDYLPMINEPELNQMVADLFPDMGYWNDWEAFIASGSNYVTDVSRFVVGWPEFFGGIYSNGDYNGQAHVEAGLWLYTIEPGDYVDGLNEAFLTYREEALKNFYKIYGEPAAE